MFTPEEITNFVNAKRNVKLLFAKRNDNWNDVVFMGPGLDKMLIGNLYDDNTAPNTIVALSPWSNQYISICDQYKATNVAVSPTDVFVVEGWIGSTLGKSIKARRLSKSSNLIVVQIDDFIDMDIAVDDYAESIEALLDNTCDLVPAFIVNDTLYITEPYFNEIKARIKSKSKKPWKNP